MSLSYNAKDYVYKLADLELTLVSGKKLDLKALRGRPLVLHLFASWCEICKKDYPLLQTIKQNTQAIIIGIAIKDKNPKDNNFYDYIAIDKDSKISRMLKTQTVPETLIINTEGVVIYRSVNALNRKEIENNVIPQSIDLF